MSEDFDDSAQLNAFEEAKMAARKKFDGMTLKELVGHMHRGKLAKEKLEAELRDVNAYYDVLRLEKVPERAELDGVESAKFEGIGRLSFRHDLFLQTKNPSELNLWLRGHKLGDLIKQTVNSSTLKAFIKNRIKDGKELPPAELVKVTPVTMATITKA